MFRKGMPDMNGIRLDQAGHYIKNGECFQRLRRGRPLQNAACYQLFVYTQFELFYSSQMIVADNDTNGKDKNRHIPRVTTILDQH